MKTFTPSKLFLFLSFLAFYVSGNAQISIVDSDFTTKLDLGDTVTTYLDTVTQQINVGDAGQNNWDLTALVVNEEFVTESKVHSTSPYSSNFPTAEYASNYAGIFAGTYSSSWVYNSVSNGDFSPSIRDC